MIPISIIIPAYNIEDYVSECMNHLIYDLSFGAEIIVVDDGSTDNTGKIAKEFADKNPELVRYYRISHSGLSAARNFGISVSRGRYVGFADGDDYVVPGCFYKAFTEAQKHDADMAVFDWAKVNERHTVISSVTEGTSENGLIPQNQKKDFIKKCQPYAWSKIYKKSFLDKHQTIRYPVGKIYEDIPVTFPLLFLSEKTIKINECLYYHVDDRRGAITNAKTSKILDIFDSLKTILEFFKTYGVFYEYRNALCYIALRHIYARFMDFSGYVDKKLKIKILDTGFDFLNFEFPDWKRHNEFFCDAFHGKIAQNIVKSRLFWEIGIKHRNFYRNIVDFKKNFSDTAGEFVRRSKANRNYYVSCSSRKIKKDTYLFESFWGREVTGTPLAICEELVRTGCHKKPKIYFVTDKENKKTNRRVLDYAGLRTVRLIDIKSRKYHKILATAEYLVNNVTFPEYFIRRPEQTYLNTWHGTPLKTLGKSEGHSFDGIKNTERNFLQANLLLYPNEYTKDKIFCDYNLDMLYTGKYMLMGYPQNDVFLREACVPVNGNDVSLNKNAADCVPRTHLNIAYMPTWRTLNTGEIRKKDIFNILRQFDSILKDNQKLFVKLHQYDRMHVDFSGFKHIFTFPCDIPTYDFLIGMDALITDYSSIMFDFMVSRRPVVLFVYDRDKYLSDRGCYIDLDELLFKKAYNFDEMREVLNNNFEGCADYGDNPDFMKKFCGELKATSGVVLNFLLGKDSRITESSVSDSRITESSVSDSRITESQVNRDFVTDCSLNRFVLKDVYVISPDRDFEKNIKMLKSTDPMRTVIVFDGEPGEREMRLLESVTRAPQIIAGRFMHVRGVDAVRLNKMFERNAGNIKTESDAKIRSDTKVQGDAKACCGTKRECGIQKHRKHSTSLTHAFSREAERLLPNITIKSVNVLSESAYGEELARSFKK